MAVYCSVWVFAVVAVRLAACVIACVFWFVLMLLVDVCLCCCGVYISVASWVMLMLFACYFGSWLRGVVGLG